MANKIQVKLILELRSKNMSRNSIAEIRGMSRNSVSDVIKRSKQLGITYDDVKNKSPDDVYALFYPERHTIESLFAPPDYDYVHKELKRVGVTLKLLWHEYKNQCAKEGSIPMGYTKYCKGYGEHTQLSQLTSHLTHKPGNTVEVDWSGPTMSYVVQSTGEIITVYLFVATLPYSQYSYVEPCLNMKQQTWLRCHVHMYEYFRGVPIRTVCDNLKTGVVKHPREGDIILNDEYDALAHHYMTAIMPTRIKKPKDKASVEGTVGNIATSIIARLRHQRFGSFEALKDHISIALEDYNKTPFQKRDGSRYEVFLQEELPYLHRLPDIPYEIAEWVYGRAIGLNSHVIYAKNSYSCPYQYYGKKVDLRITDTQLEIYYQNERLQTHNKFPAYITNRYSTHEEDMPDKLKINDWDDERIRRWASKIGPSTTMVINRIFSSVTIKEQGYNSSLSVLRLSNLYSEARLETACEIALSKIKVPRYNHLKSILSTNQDLLYKPDKASANETSVEGYIRGAEYYGGKKR